MSTKNELPGSEPPKFYSLFVPNRPDWFQDLLKNKVQALLERKQEEMAARLERKLTEAKKQGETLTREEDTWLEQRKKNYKKTAKGRIAKEHGSLSDYLIDLIIKDLHARGLISEKEAEAYRAYAKDKPDITKTRFTTAKDHATFSLYLPKRQEQSWIREKLDSEFIKTKIGVKSRSIYIWDLFVKDNASSLKKSQLQEWEKTKKKKSAAAA